MFCRRIESALWLSLFVTTSCFAQTKVVEADSLTLTTKDNVVLHFVYYPGAESKDTIPVILLHGWTGPRGAGSGRDFDSLASALQSAGHAVIVPDLRGHGGSTMRRRGGGTRRSFHRDRLGPRDFAAMVQFDVEAVKRFLMEKHNQGQLNIELLCVIGSDMGAAVAANWAVHDWSWPALPNLKQGQDVKALVLISPAQSFRNLSVQKALSHKALRGMPTMIMHGEKDKDANRSARRIHKQLQRYHRQTESRKQQTLFFVALPTSLQGTKLLNSKLDTEKQIQEFLQLRLVNRRSRVPWRARSSS